MVENNCVFPNMIVQMNQAEREKISQNSYTKILCSSTVRVYCLLVVNGNDYINLAKDEFVNIKDKRQQMESIFVIKLTSHIEKWNGPNDLPTGCVKLLHLLRNVNGTHFKPVLPDYLPNEDCSSQYYSSDGAKNNFPNNGWFIVISASLDSRGKDSIWTNIEIEQCLQGNMSKICL